MSEAGGDRGFTLVEVLVALAILSLSLPVLFSVFGESLHRTQVSEARTVAASLAETLLAQAGIERPLRIGEETGVFHGPYRWRMRTTPYDDGGGTAAWKVDVYRVAATVSWGESAREALTLTTLRLAPKETR